MLSEHRVASPALRVAGTLDCLGVLDGRPALLDFATGNPADVHKDLQTAAYHRLALDWRVRDYRLAAFLQEHGTNLQRYAVALRKDGTFSVEHYTNVSDGRHFVQLVEAQHIVDAHRARQREAVA
jgi:hypothetical protein